MHHVHFHSCAARRRWLNVCWVLKGLQSFRALVMRTKRVASSVEVELVVSYVERNIQLWKEKKCHDFSKWEGHFHLRTLVRWSSWRLSWIIRHGRLGRRRSCARLVLAMLGRLRRRVRPSRLRGWRLVNAAITFERVEGVTTNTTRVNSGRGSCLKYTTFSESFMPGFNLVRTVFVQNGKCSPFSRAHSHA